MKKTRILALILTLAMLVQFVPTTLNVFAASNDTIVLYPEYPEKIEKDYMYRVYVSQGGEEYEIPVYNDMRHSNHYVRGDQATNSEVDRRFCQFSATPSVSNPVTVRVVANIDFNKCAVIPSIKQVVAAVNENEITFELVESGQYVFRLNEDNLTNLSIFADAVETNVPNKAASNVVVFDEQNPAPNAIGTQKSNWTSYPSNTIFYIEGWQEVEFFELRTGQQLYIAPGAVLNARVQVMDGQKNITISGRGMLRDFNDTRAYNSNSELKEARDFNYLLTLGSSWYQGDSFVSNVNINDIILFDSKGFNLVFQGAQNCTVDGIKIVSNEISTDGVSVWGSNNITVKNSFLYVNDNAFVIDQAISLKLDNLLVGTTIATFFPQNGIEGAHEYKNINLFRSSTVFEPASGFSPKIYGTAAAGTVLIENLSAIDCVAPTNGTSKMGKLFATYNSATGSKDVKNITFKNVTLPETNNSYVVQVGVSNAKAGNYNIVLKNVYVGSTPLTKDTVKFTDSTSSGKPSTLTVSNDGTYTPIEKSGTTSGATVYETYVRDAATGKQFYALSAPYAKNDTVYVSAKYTAQELGFNTYFDADDMSLTIYDEDALLRATVGSKNIIYNNSIITLSAPVEYDEEVMVPVDFFQKTIAPNTYVSGKDIVIGEYSRGSAENLVVNGDFENKYSLGDWTTINFARLTRSTNAYTGSYALRFADQNIYKADKIETTQGAYQDAREIVRENGPGVYRITFWAKCNTTGVDLTDTSSYYIFASLATGWMNSTPSNGAKAQALTSSWKQYTQDVYVGTSGSPSIKSAEVYAAIIIKGAVDVSVDDITLTKISDITNSGGAALYTVTSDAVNEGSNYSLSYGTTGKSVSVSGTNSAILDLKFETASDYITVGATRQTASGSTNTAKATIEVAYPSNYDRTARVFVKNAAGTIVGETTINIPAYTTNVLQVVDFDSNLVVKDSYTVGETLDLTGLKLTNVLYNDGTIGTVTDNSKIRVTGADTDSVGKKTITVTYDNKSVTYTTTVVEPAVTNDAKLKTLGSNIRLASGELSAGLRFAATIEKNAFYDRYYPTTDADKKYVYSADSNYQFGAILVPTALIPSGESVVSMFEKGDSTVLVAEGKKVYSQNEESLTFTGVLVGIPETVKDYTNVIQTAFYVRYRESATDEWNYIFSTTIEDSYYSVAVKAAEKTYNYTNLPNPTNAQKKTIEALNKIIDFVEKDSWIEGDWW